MKTQTPTPPSTKQDRKISQAESQLLADWLRQQGFDIKAAASLWKLRPSVVAGQFDVKVDDILRAIRRIE